jgi:hypothetical protein
VADDDGVDSMLRFQLERGVNETKCCRKMKQSQRTRLSSMGRNSDMARWRDDVDPKERRHRGGEREETTSIGLTQILLSGKMIKIHTVDSAAINIW